MLSLTVGSWPFVSGVLLLVVITFDIKSSFRLKEKSQMSWGY